MVFFCQHQRFFCQHLVNWQKVSLPKSLGGLGIRTAREANTSLLGKLVWDVQQDRDKLWVQLLRNRYNVKGSFLTSGNKAGSPTWSAITKAKDILKGGYEFRIGAGNISFWFDHWTDIGPLHNLLPYIDIHDLDLKLKDVYDGNEWKLDNLYTLLPDHLKNFISGNYIYINQDVQDLHIWGASTNGSYSTKSGFSWLLQQRDNAPIEQAWKWIWKLPTQQNVRLFFWLAFHNSIPTLSVLHHRGISTTADCKSCQGAEETLLHCLRDCPMAKRLWQSLGFTEAMFFQQQDTHYWLKQGATGPNDTLFIAAVWWIWKCRNAKCFNDETMLFTQLLLCTLNLAETFKICFKSGDPPSISTRLISWHSKDHEGTILNVDGSSLGNPGPAGFGGLARTSDGGWLFGFCGHIGFSDVLKAELLGILQGLRLVWDRGYRNLICYTDSLNARSLILEHVTIYHRYATILQDIRDLMKLPWKVELRHTLREGNQCADLLAKRGATSEDNLQLFHSPPPDLRVLLLGDAAGVAFPRGFPRVDQAD